MKRSAWLAHLHSNERARLRLLCLPYAAGGASLYRFLPRVLSSTLLEGLDIWAVEYPGHGERHGEAPLRDFSSLADALTDAVGLLLAQETVLFGYSLGAMLGFELARRWRERTGGSPSALLVAACAAPQFTTSGPDVTSSPAALADFLGRQNAEAARSVAQRWPWFQAVFGIRRTYFYTPAQPLACPITAFGGTDDADVSEEALVGWSTQTALLGSFAYHLLPGQRHLFLREPLFLRLLGRSLQSSIELAQFQAV